MTRNNERDELAGIIQSPERFDGGPVSCGPNEVYAARTADAVLAAGYVKPRQVTTAEELDALPVGSVVLSEEVKHHEGGWALSYQRWQDGDWHRGARSGSTHPDNFLPATVLHVGSL